MTCGQQNVDVKNEFVSVEIVVHLPAHSSSKYD